MRDKLIGLVSFIIFLGFSYKARPDFYESLEDRELFGEYLLSQSEKKISMDLEKASLVDVLKVLSQQSGLNFVTVPEVEDKKITLYLEGVPLRKALDMICKANNLKYEFYPESKTFVVEEVKTPKIKLQTRVYPLKYARVSSSKLAKEIDQNTSGGIVEAVKGNLSEYGKIFQDFRSNSLIITDIPEQFPLIEETIKKLDVPVPRVIIEVEMLDVKKSLADRLGLDTEGGFYAQFIGGTREVSWPISWLKTPSERGGDLFPKASVTLGTLDFTNFQAVLQFFSSDVSTKFLARPKILTLSGEPAEIKISTQEAVGVTTTIEEGRIAVSDVERMETGTVLKIVPQVNSEDEITLTLEPKVIVAKNSNIQVSGMTQGTVKDPEERGIKTTVRLKNNQTLMIGGLIINEDSGTSKKIPYLADIPLLGVLFRSKNTSNEERELLVFITPRIMKDFESFQGKGFVKKREQGSSERSFQIGKALETIEAEKREK